MALCETVGIVSVGKKQNLYVEPLAQQHVDTAQRGLDTGGVAVVYDCDVVGKSMYQPNLAVGKRRARRGHNILNTTLMHRDDIKISLDKYAFIMLYYRLLCLIQSVKFLAFCIDGRFRRVDIFRQIFF